MMQDYVRKYNAKGKKCLFVGAVGDNFYSTGVKDDQHWKTMWSDIYGTNEPTSALYDIPWLAVMGNHDLGNSDPKCACGGGCKQFNNGSRPSGTERFWMPDYNWYYHIPVVDLEIIGLDTNSVDVGGLGGDGCKNGAKDVCQQCGGQGNIASFLNSQYDAGKALLTERARVSSARTTLIMQHYDGKIGKELKEQFEGNRPTNAVPTQVLSAYGHAHDQTCQGSRAHGCDVILTGGGGGWKGGGYFGFTAVHLTDDGGFQTTLETDEVRIPQNSCNYLVHDHSDAEKDSVFV
jgi:hypothetical protein